jgi:hypothetical protein
MKAYGSGGMAPAFNYSQINGIHTLTGCMGQSVFFEKIIFLQLKKAFCAFYGIRMFIAIFKTSRSEMIWNSTEMCKMTESLRYANW